MKANMGAASKEQPLIKIYNTLTRQKDSLVEKKVGMYVCGPTAYDVPHIGHARSAYIFDMIRKYLEYRGKTVKFVRNVTDIDDKIINKARQELKEDEQSKEPSLQDKVTEVALRYHERYREDMNLLGLTEPDVEPKATETIPDMVKFIKILIEKGYAYEVSGNVYFEIRKFEKYGRLSGQSLDQMEEGARVALDKNKKDPLDFALWKASKENEPFWKSPWGRGRPGWHIECSVMSTKILGKNFLVHGGGLDLVFPHHENEIAQTVCAGKKSAKYWIHNGLLTINGQKMAKSLGNFITIRDFHAKYKDLDLLKLLFLSSRYSHPVDYTEEKIEKIKKSKEKIIIFLQKVYKHALKNKKHKLPPNRKKWEAPFEAAMDDNFNTPLALATIFRCIDASNKIVEKERLSENDQGELALSSIFIRKISDIFGLDLKVKKINDKAIRAKVREREEARKKKDFERADRIRRELLDQGVVIEDTKEGPRCRKKV